MHSNLISKDLQFVWHPFTPQKDAPEPLVITRGNGVYLYDIHGNAYIDAISSWWVNLHGHAHPYIAEKIFEQASKLEHVIFAGFTHEPAILLAERLISILPGNFSKIFYSDNGSTAVEVAIKMAVQYWWNKENVTGYQIPVTGYPKPARRNKILAFKNGYHGDTFGSMSVSDRGVFTLAFHDMLFEVIFIDPTNEPTFNLQLSTFNPNEVACFIYEPLVQGAGGMKMYDAETLNILLKILKSHEVICIADEVMTGFGRTGKLFASEYLEEKPDIICLSKGLTGGTMALGATACTKKIHDAFVDDDKTKTFFHGHSFTANPLACTAALASLDLLNKETCKISIQNIQAKHNDFISYLPNCESSITNKIKNIRQLGTILAFEINVGKDEYLNDVSKLITQRALAHSVYLRPLGNTLYFMPPYCIKDEELDQVYDTVVNVIGEL